MPDAPRILMVRLSSLGDLVRITRFVDPLRQHWPTCKLDLLTSPLGAALFQDVGLFDAIHVWDRHAPLARQWRMARQLRQQKYDLYLDVHCKWRTLILGGLVGAKRTARSNSPLRKRILHLPSPPRPLREMLDRAGCQTAGSDLDASIARIPVPEYVKTMARQRLREVGWDGCRPLVLIAPGSSGRWASKRWGAKRFKSLGTRLIADGYTIVVLGDAAEHALAAQVAGNQQAALNLAGQTTLSQLLGIASLAQAAVTNDSGPMHIAAAVGTPTLAIFGPTDPNRHGPGLFYGPPHQHLVADVPCHPCYHGTCPLARHECMLALSVDQVYAAVQSMMMPSLQRRT